ncbi:FkbM family methyltransferase [Mucilaginibacter sp. UR6-11]|uniref:FkbM family methyltransferase n=1 Tax=Mucilaginibacter sp. UR6-11 TaxID=1435644 RepID=UPI001E455A1C|nr:FkbM family methyltransferase [Mucilaginibacter sp. UR6-11]MCC8423737.1 FkbM family methyltransferase [Mucilaginibacter sp. UR6-11]
MIYRILSKIERICGRLQGKGWGAYTVSHEVNLLTKVIKAPGLAVDIGGNVGDYTAELLKKFDGIEVHVFEPSQVNNEKLITRFKNQSNVLINKAAVSDKAGVASLYTDVPGSGLASLTKRESLKFESFEEVDVITFESYWKEKLNRKTIDIIKIDVEGHELDVLNGMGGALAKTKVIQFEFGGCNIDTRTYFYDFWQFFKKHNFNIFRITPLGLQPMLFYSAFDDFFNTTNFICVNQNI